MINVRKGVFETNSSSTHSICISKHDDYVLPSTLYFRLGDFGWESEIYKGAEDLASYLWTAVVDFYGDCYSDYKMVEDYKNYLYEKLYEYGVECEFELPIYDEKYSWCVNANIDHVAELDDLLSSLRKSPRKLIRFLFSPDSFILCGNDNSDWYYDKHDELDFSEVDEYYKGN